MNNNFASTDRSEDGRIESVLNIRDCSRTMLLGALQDHCGLALIALDDNALESGFSRPYRESSEQRPSTGILITGRGSEILQMEPSR